MGKSTLAGILAGYLIAGVPARAAAAPHHTLAAIPRVDVHAHLGTMDLMDHYIQVGNVLKEEFNVNLDIWIDLGSYREIENKNIDYLDEAEKKYGGRFLMCLNDYKIADGLRYSPEELAEWQARGVVGYKIWVGVSTLVDDPANDPTFTKMEQIGMLGASVHISQPYPTKWCQDAIKHWDAHNAWERVLDRHPRLKVVQAHMLDHFYSDEQLEYLQFVLERYPNVNLDLAARIQWFHRMNRDKLRAFLIKYADRILFGTDIADRPKQGNYRQIAEGYQRCFEILETADIVKGGFYSLTGDVRGVELPLDVLEKIYYKNAARLYPRVKAVLKQRGYDIE